MKKQTKEMIIQDYMVKLELTREEAEELFIYDEGEISNEEADAIEEKISTKKAEAKDKAPSQIGKVLTMKAKKKIDAAKESVISTLFGFIKESDVFISVQDMGATKVSFIDSEGSYYTVSVTKHKKKPDGYRDEVSNE